MNTEVQTAVVIEKPAAGLSPNPHFAPSGTGRSRSAGRAALHLGGRALWHIPGPFTLARAFGPRYSLRCVIFHHIANSDSLLTHGLGVTTSLADFEAALAFLCRHYTPVSLPQALGDPCALPARPVLVTFDDAYASVAKLAAPLCRQYKIPAVFFINAALLDNQRLALDNLVCYVTNVAGINAVNAAAQEIANSRLAKLRSMSDVFDRLLPAVSLSERESFRDALLRMAAVPEQDLAAAAGIYLTSEQLRELPVFNFEIGNHTYSHVHCRALSSGDFAAEIDRNKTILEMLCGKRVRAFSVPYGSSADLSADLAKHLQRTGHEGAFLAESCANPLPGGDFRLDRLSVKASDEAGFFSEIEVLPRIRSVRNLLSPTRRDLYVAEIN